MNNLGKILVVSFALATMLVLPACKKNVAGPKGDAGPPGAPGGNGNLKVYSETFTAATWTLSGKGWESHFFSTKISNNVLTKGEVEVYMQIDNDWWTLPYGVGDLFMQASFEQNWVHLKYFKIHGGPPAKPDTINFKVAILEPTQ